jgi:voltage-gated potassium channel
VVSAVPVFRALRTLRVIPVLLRLDERAAESFHGRAATSSSDQSRYGCSSPGWPVMDAEGGHPEANIINFGDAVWWAATTVTTVGYGIVSR